MTHRSEVAVGKAGKGRPELAKARKRLGLSQDEMATALWVSPTTWGRWERGRQEIRPVYRARMAEVFGVPSSEVERWIDGGTPVDTQAWLLPDCNDLSLPATVEAAGRLWRCDVDPERRQVLATLPFVPSALGTWLSAWSYGASADSTAREGSGPVVGMADVRRVDEARQAFGRMDKDHGAGLVRPAVVDYLNTTVGPLLRGRYTDKVGAALMSSAAGMTAMAGWTAFDLNHHGQAQQYYGQALKLAKNGGDPFMGLWVLEHMSHQALHLKQSAQAVWLTRAAVDTAHHAQASPRVTAMFLVEEAWASAMQARPGESADKHTAKRIHRQLAEAERLFAQGGTDRDPSWAEWHDEPELIARMGMSWNLLGEHKRAATCAEQAVHALAAKRPRSAQLNRLNAANAYLAMGEVEQAVNSARAAVPLTTSLTSTRATDRLRAFAARLDPYGTTVQVREFRACLDTQLARA
ncbi:helix-turn-helix domain-containing protein [Sphaerisporangium aureirubrum]|uniref:Helix-turn-helix domain-containing protein n=1 Tax=Sphaerisporangium aureirubrum TaxID=1544736 RepID=A0ABW1NP45_9ACTN